MPARTLVVYASRTGNTRRLAERIAARMGADVEPIGDHIRRSGIVGYFRSGFQAALARTVEIDPTVHDPADYDLVVIGTPVWNMALSSPARSYLRRYRDRLPAVAFFCTCGGRGGERAFFQMAHECRKQPAATLIVREAELSREITAGAVERFAAALGGIEPVARPTPEPPPPVETHRTL